MKMVKLARCYVTKANQAKERGIEFKLSFITFVNLKKQTHCFYTGEEFTKENPLSLERINNNKGYVDGNVIAVTTESNRMKSGLDPQGIAVLREKAKMAYVREMTLIQEMQQIKQMNTLKPIYNQEQFAKYVGLSNHFHRLKSFIKQRNQIIQNHPRDDVRITANRLKIESMEKELETNVKPALRRLFLSASGYKRTDATTEIDDSITKAEARLEHHSKRHNIFYHMGEALNELAALEGDNVKLLELGLYNPRMPNLNVSPTDVINTIVTSVTLRKACA